MTRRGLQRAEQSEAFFTANPELQSWNTKIEPVKDSPTRPESFALEISQENDPVFGAEPELSLSSTPTQTSALFFDGPDYFFEGSGQVVVSEHGIGIGGFEPEDSPEWYAIEADELLGFYIDPGNIYFTGSAPSPTEVDEFGLKAFEIDFVADGSGTIVVEFRDYQSAETLVAELEFTARPGRDKGSFTALQTLEPRFDSAEISTTGSLEVSLTGISFDTNFESGFDPI